MAERPAPYICVHCGSRLPGPPATMVQRRSGQLAPICHDGLLAQMPSRYELERLWLDLHLQAPGPGSPAGPE